MPNGPQYETKLTNAQGVSIGLGKKADRSSDTKRSAISVAADAAVSCLPIAQLAYLKSNSALKTAHSVIPVSGHDGKAVFRINHTKEGAYSVWHPPLALPNE